jgi:hypothetical protein
MPSFNKASERVLKANRNKKGGELIPPPYSSVFVTLLRLQMC